MTKPVNDHPLEDLVQFALMVELRKFVTKAERRGFVLIADSDSQSIRIMPKGTADAAEDLRNLGDVVKVHGACGGGGSGRSGRSHPMTHGA